jgi:hypothetical protein
MITIFSDFCQFSAKKICIVLKTQRYDKMFAKTSSGLSKNAIFCHKFCETVLKIVTLVPEPSLSVSTLLKRCRIQPLVSADSISNTLTDIAESSF